MWAKTWGKIVEVQRQHTRNNRYVDSRCAPIMLLLHWATPESVDKRLGEKLFSMLHYEPIFVWDCGIRHCPWAVGQAKEEFCNNRRPIFCPQSTPSLHEPPPPPEITRKIAVFNLCSIVRLHIFCTKVAQRKEKTTKKTYLYP